MTKGKKRELTLASDFRLAAAVDEAALNLLVVPGVPLGTLLGPREDFAVTLPFRLAVRPLLYPVPGNGDSILYLVVAAASSFAVRLLLALSS